MLCNFVVHDVVSIVACCLSFSVQRLLVVEQFRWLSFVRALVVMCCLMCSMCCVFFVVCCLSCVDLCRYLFLVVARCVLFDVRCVCRGCLLFVVNCCLLLLIVQCLALGVCCVLFGDGCR